MGSVFSGKWVWVWNRPRCLGGDPARVARRHDQARCAGALVKPIFGATVGLSLTCLAYSN